MKLNKIDWYSDTTIIDAFYETQKHNESYMTSVPSFIWNFFFLIFDQNSKKIHFLDKVNFIKNLNMIFLMWKISKLTLNTSKM